MKHKLILHEMIIFLKDKFNHQNNIFFFEFKNTLTKYFYIKNQTFVCYINKRSKLYIKIKYFENNYIFYYGNFIYSVFYN